MKLRCVIFDLDNTLVDSDLDFAAIRAEIGCDEPILEHRAKVGPDERKRIDDILERHESRVAATCPLRHGARELLEYLRAHGVSAALLTRNSRRSVETVINRHKLVFDFVVCRDEAPHKPSPEPVRLICGRLGVGPAETMVVGDFLFDIQCGQAAGCRTMLIDGPNRGKFTADPDYYVLSLDEALTVIREIVEEGKKP